MFCIIADSLVFSLTNAFVKFQAKVQMRSFFFIKNITKKNYNEFNEGFCMLIFANNNIGNIFLLRM